MPPERIPHQRDEGRVSISSLNGSICRRSESYPGWARTADLREDEVISDSYTIPDGQDVDNSRDPSRPDSLDRKRARRTIFFGAGTCAVISVATSILFYFLATAYNSCADDLDPTTCEGRVMANGIIRGLEAGTVALLISGSVIGAVFFSYRSIRLQAARQVGQLNLARQELSVAEDELRREVSSDAQLGLSALWGLTHKRLDYYHRIATEQAESSFRYARIAMTAGFVVLVLAVVPALLAGNEVASIVAGSLGAIAAGLGGFISRTFIRSQETAAQHLRAYFLQPLEFSRYLVAERLLDTLPEDKKAEGILAIVRGISLLPLGEDAILQSNAPAQSSHNESPK
jgi:hypothetical protein